MKRSLTLKLTVMLLVVAACGGDDETGVDTPQPSATVPAQTTSSSSPATTSDSSSTAPSVTNPPTARPDLASVRVGLEEVARFDAPIALVTRPGTDELYVAERAGFVRLLSGGDAILDISAETTTDGERGLLGMVFSPDGGRLYVSSTDVNGNSRLDEYLMGPGAGELDIASRRNLMQVAQPFSNHNGGHVAFGPDGLLYFGLGDGGSGGDPQQRAQNPAELLGKMLRIDPAAVGDSPYSIPADNPFASGGGRGEIFALGLRNPWRFSFDAVTGDMWIADVGQGEIEEIDYLAAETGAGANFGWDKLEGTQPFEGEAPPGAIPPIFEYDHSQGCSVTGGVVYRGDDVPELAGAYLFGDYCASRLRALVAEGGVVVEERDLDVSVPDGELVSFAQDAGNEIYVLSLSGPVYRLVAA